MQHHKYSLTELENMMPWEREIYMGLLMKWIKEENERMEREKSKQKQRGTKMAVEVTVDPEVAQKVDRNGDGHISQEEMEMDLEFKRKALEDADARRDAMRQMAWFALWGMLLYPFAVVLANWVGLDQASKILGDMAATYFVSVAAIVAAFFAGNAYSDKKKQVRTNGFQVTRRRK